MATSTDVSNFRIAVQGPCATLSIDRATRRNALNLAMWRAIPAIVADFESHPDVRLIVITGEGPDFSAGADISEFEELRATPDGARRYDATTEAAYNAIRNSKLPSVAAIRGACIGGGFGLAMACDIRIAMENAVFAIPAARLGLAYPVNSLAHITSVVGPAVAKDMLFTARRLTAAEALSAGILTRVTEGELDDLLAKTVDQISVNAPLSLRAAKTAIDVCGGADGETGPQNGGRIRDLVDACFESEDYMEGRTAFLEKRPPVFSGK